MEQLQTRSARTSRIALVAVALFVLLAIVAFASRSGFGHPTATRPTPAYVNWATSIFLVVFVLMIPFAAWAYSIQTREFLARRERASVGRRLLRYFGIVIVLGVAFLLRLAFGKKFFPHVHPPGFHPAATPHVKGGKGGAAQYEPTFQWPVLWVTVALVVVAAAAYVWWRRRHPLDPPPPLRTLSQTDEVVETIGDAIGDLESEPDPRRAVIAAYARMEAAFGRQGLKRNPSETAVEYLRRILLGLGSGADPVRRLTDLFEQAKFSRHEIDGAMKADAIDALAEIRADLQAAT
jgi:hypothetical protein